MGKAIPSMIGSEIFAKKDDLKARVRAIVDKYEVNTFLELDDLGFCVSLFAYHPQWDEKKGVGIHALEVRLDEYRKKYLHIHRLDGSNIDISWVRCVDAIK